MISLAGWSERRRRREARAREALDLAAAQFRLRRTARLLERLAEEFGAPYMDMSNRLSVRTTKGARIPEGAWRVLQQLFERARE